MLAFPLLKLFGAQTEFGLKALGKIGQVGKANLIHDFRYISFFVL